MTLAVPHPSRTERDQDGDFRVRCVHEKCGAGTRLESLAASLFTFLQRQLPSKGRETFLDCVRITRGQLGTLYRVGFPEQQIDN
jgi:hypothetical protein